MIFALRYLICAIPETRAKLSVATALDLDMGFHDHSHTHEVASEVEVSHLVIFLFQVKLTSCSRYNRVSMEGWWNLDSVPIVNVTIFSRV